MFTLDFIIKDTKIEFSCRHLFVCLFNIENVDNLNKVF
jgi:hypothetical protein